MADLYLPIQWNACADPVKIFQSLNKVVNKYYSLEQQGVKIKQTKYLLTLYGDPQYTDITYACVDLAIPLRF